MRVRIGFASVLCVMAGSPELLASEAPSSTPEDADGVVEVYNPRTRQLPRTHRFRLGIAIDYVRLSVAVNSETGERQRFHLAPLQLDLAYQAQFLRYFMVRPSFAIGANVGNTFVSMPLILHPQIHAGYQGRLFGAAVGYGFFHPPIQRKDYTSTIRGGEGRPVFLRAHHIDIEASVTTRVHRRRAGAPGAGALSAIVRLGAVKGSLEHFDTINKRWRFMMTFNLGWYFGDGRRQKRRNSRP